ncbi:hypothetical protein NP493_923g01021 [Ridgeia piscesae]|uniref:Uncharacterized protein n=1 Tax=Ridgeia piscesae TaxID=27915 RepID=A0AAD9KJR4_RIDPI|nr:hypothetical protein NP493_923g01021 [Ridgeia piscesae]
MHPQTTRMKTKKDFYKKLQTLCDKLKEKDTTILMGDMNAKIGSYNSGEGQMQPQTTSSAGQNEDEAEEKRNQEEH